MTSEEQIINQLSTLIYQQVKMLTFMERADSRMELMLTQFRGRILYNTEKPVEYKKEVEERVTTPEPPYDWWELANGDFAKIYKTELKGEIYDPSGKLKDKETWNPLSNRSNSRKDHDMIKRKSGDSPKGWPEWTK